MWVFAYIPLIEGKCVIADEQRCVEGLGQHCVDSDHDQQDGQLQNRVQSEEHCTGHHRQHASKHEILSINSQTTTPLTPHRSMYSEWIDFWTVYTNARILSILLTDWNCMARSCESVCVGGDGWKDLWVEADIWDWGRCIKRLVPEWDGFIEITPKLW